MRHRAAGVELGRALERADRLVVVETVQKGQALVEVALRLRRARGDGPGERAELVERRRVSGAQVAGMRDKGEGEDQ